MKDAKEFERKLDELQDEFNGIAELYAANVLIESGEVVPLIKIRIFNKEKNANQTKKESTISK